MNALIQKLIELQALDLRAAELRQQIDSFPERLLQIDQSVKTASDAVAAAKQRVADLRRDRKKLEMDVDDWRGKIKKYKDQLYQVKSNEAYRALQEEIRNAEAEMGRAEDRLLEDMVGGEEAERVVKEAEKALKEAEGVAASEREKLASLAEQTQKRHKELRKTVGDLQESIDFLRLSIKYLVFDLEATRRENHYLRKMLEENQDS